MKEFEWGKNPALLIIDVTRALADEEVRSSYPPCVEAAVAIQKLLTNARMRKIPIIFTKGGKLSHTSSGVPLTDVERGGWAKKNGIRTESEETARPYMEILPEFAPNQEEIVLEKSRSSAFFKTMLDTYLSSMKIDTVIVTGMMTSGCIRATVTDAFSNDLNIILPEECVADKRIEAHEYHMEEMGLKYGKVEKMQDVIDYIKQIS
jgi:nicotinamidase-related amidase